jgi:hypothetical protein
MNEISTVWRTELIPGKVQVSWRHRIIVGDGASIKTIWAEDIVLEEAKAQLKRRR